MLLMSWVVELRLGLLITGVRRAINMLRDVVVSLDKCEKQSKKMWLRIILDQHISLILVKLIAKMQTGEHLGSRIFSAKHFRIIVEAKYK